MKKNPEVDRWFAEKKPAAAPALQRVRETILGADDLEGTGPNARFMHFAGESEVKARAAELRDLSRRWCSLMSAPAGSSRPKKTS